jgi:hypothetical protein
MRRSSSRTLTSTSSTSGAIATAAKLVFLRVEASKVKRVQVHESTGDRTQLVYPTPIHKSFFLPAPEARRPPRVDFCEDVLDALALGVGDYFEKTGAFETIAVALILSIDFRVTSQIVSPGGGSVAGLIANNFGDSGPSGRSALIAAGLALFVVTLLVNLGARVIVNRARKGPAE